MVVWPAASLLSAPKSADVTACAVSTFPATTAEGYSGFKKHFFGIIISIGSKQPSFNGMLSLTKQRNTYNTHAFVIEVGALKLELSGPLVPVKSTFTRRLFFLTAIDTVIFPP